MEGEISQLKVTVEPEGVNAGKQDEEIPKNLQNPVFLEAWRDWKIFRRKNRWSMKPSFLALKLKTFSEWGPDLSAEAMRQSINQGYQGVFKPNDFTRRRLPSKAMKPDIPEIAEGVPF
jgi:hypothetical protein